MSDEKSQKRVLGRGLATLIPGADRISSDSPSHPASAEASKEGDLIMAPLSKIALNPYQPRENIAPEELSELTESVRQFGVLQPVLIRPKSGGSWELVAGERRFRAATAAGLKEIPAVVRVIDDRSTLAIALIENLQRENLNPIETAKAYRRLQEEFGLSQSEVAREVGKPQPSIANTLRLLSLPAPVVDSIASRQITEGHGKAILAVEGDEDRLSLWKETVERKLNVRETERKASAMKRRPDPAGSKSIPRGIPSKPKIDQQEELEYDLSMALGARTKIKIERDCKGAIEITFYDQLELDAVIDRLLRRDG